MPLLQETRAGDNGGFPEPPAGEPYRVVRCTHTRCGAETRVRLPRPLPERAIHRVVCGGCAEPYPAASSLAGLLGIPAAPAAENGAAPPAATKPVSRTLLPPPRRRLPRPKLAPPSLPSRPSNARLWGWISIPLALAAVVAGLALIQGSEGNPSPAAVEASNADPGAARFISRPGYSLALPDGWSKADAPEGAVFAARSDDGLADATLWIERDPKLGFDEFEQRSLAQLAEIGSNPRVVDRVEGPSIESTIVRLQADTAGSDGTSSPYRVTLRAAGPYRLYFATAIQPGAAAKLRGDTELMHGSLRPEVELAGVETGSAATP